MTKDYSATGDTARPPASFGDRLRFVIWFAGLRLGVATDREFAAEIGKGATQLATWVAEKPRPAFENIRLMAEKVGLSAAWLDDPQSLDAREPELWPAWYAARAARALRVSAMLAVQETPPVPARKKTLEDLATREGTIVTRREQSTADFEGERAAKKKTPAKKVGGRKPAS